MVYLLSSVLVEQYTQYDVALNNKWVMRGGTAVLRCVINPPYVTDYVKVIGWKRAGHDLHSSKLLIFFFFFVIPLHCFEHHACYKISRSIKKIGLLEREFLTHQFTRIVNPTSFLVDKIENDRGKEKGEDGNLITLFIGKEKPAQFKILYCLKDKVNFEFIHTSARPLRSLILAAI